MLLYIRMCSTALRDDEWRSEEFMIGAMAWLGALTLIFIIFIIILIILSCLRCRRLRELDMQITASKVSRLHNQPYTAWSIN